MAKQQQDPRVDKRRVEMRSVVLDPSGVTVTYEATDYVPPDILEAYVADARTRWQAVLVSDEPDAGPAGYDGPTERPRHLAGKKAADFARYGNSDTPENALDEHLDQEGS